MMVLVDMHKRIAHCQGWAFWQIKSAHRRGWASWQCVLQIMPNRDWSCRGWASWQCVLMHMPSSEWPPDFKELMPVALLGDLRNQLLHFCAVDLL